MTKNDESIILTAPVMIPDFKDCDFERGEPPLSVEQITDFRKSFEQYGFIDKHHSIRGPASKDHLVGKVLKSFQLDGENSFQWLDGTIHTYPAGTWMLTSEITDKSAIKQVQNGQINGYSASVFNSKVADEIKASMKASEGMLIKDVNDPKVAVVSLVGKPCVGDAKFCKCKFGGEKMSEDTAKSKLDSITQILGLDKTEYATKSDVEELKDDLSSFESSLKSFSETISDTVDKAIKSALEEMAVKETKEDEEEEKKEETSEEEVSEDEEEKEDEKQKKKGSAKGQKIHNNKEEQKKALKSDSAIVYEIMGRTMNGIAKRD